MPLVQAGEVRLHYETHGQGEALLLISGTGVTHHPWMPFQVPFFREHYRVIVYDHRGLGASDKPDEPYSTRGFAADAAGLLEALEVPRAHVMGHSMGGRVAQWLAIDHPQKVRSLVLSGTGSGQVAGLPPQERGIPLETALELLEKGYERYYMEHFGANEFMFPAEFVAQHPELIQQRMALAREGMPPLKSYLRHVIARQEHETGHLLARIQAPTLVIVGGADRSQGGTGDHVRSSEQLARGIKGAELVVIPGAAHAYLWQKAEEANRAILDFLRRH